MTMSIRERLELLKSGKSVQEILAATTSDDQEELLRRCAVVRTFDAEVLDLVLRRFPTAIDETAVTTSGLLSSPFVEVVSWADDEHRIVPDERAKLLDEWNKHADDDARQKLSQALVKHYEQRGDDLEWLYHLPGVQHDRALEEFENRCTTAAAAYDLTRYEDLVSLFEGRNIGKAFESACRRHRARLSALALWSDEFYRTGRYLRSKSIVSALDELLLGAIPPPDASEPEKGLRKWALQLHAGGGAGKTMFIRWAFARRCVFEQEIPCARVDFDDRRKLELAKNPGQLAVELARQWSRQIAGAPQLYNPVGTPSEFPLRPLGYNLASALPTRKPAVLVLDTLEELLIAHRQTLVSMLRQVEKLHENCPQLVVILAGRYDLRERLKESYGETGKAAIDLPVQPFEPTEAREYLVKIRELPEDDARIPAIIKRAEGNPLKLSLYVEILEHEPGITAETIEKERRVDLAFLIRRVVNHISDLKLRWILRYGVIPSSLTLEFLTNVLAEPLRQEIWNQSRDNISKGLPDSLNALEPFGRIADRSKSPEGRPEDVDFKALWDVLKRYASTASWVREEGDALIFSPDVLTPMRGLLLEQEKEVFIPLHQRALDYYRNKADDAERQGKDSLAFQRQVVFHDFQRRGEDAAGDWRGTLASKQSPAWRKGLAEEVVGRDYISDDDPPRPIERFDGARMIAPCDLVFAYFQLARAQVEEARGASAPSTLWSDATDSLARLDKFAQSRSAVLADDPRIELLRGEIAARDAREFLGRSVESERVRGGAEAERAIKALGVAIADGNNETRISALWLRAELFSALERRGAIGDYYQLENLLRRAADRASIRTLLERRAFALLAFDQFREALGDAVKGYHEARKQENHAEVVKLDLLGRDILLRTGRPTKAIEWRRRADGAWKTPAPRLATWEVGYWFVKSRGWLLLLDPHRSLDLHREGRKERRKAIHADEPEAALLPEKPEEREHRAAIAIAMKHFPRAYDELLRAKAEWQELGKNADAERVRARMMALSLFELGDLNAVADDFSHSPAAGYPNRSEPALHLVLLWAGYLDRRGKPGEARALVDPLLNTLDPETPPRFRVHAALTALSICDGSPPQPYLEALVQALSKITPATARAAMLDGLDRCPVLRNLPENLTQRFLDLLPSLSDPALSTRERGVHGLRRAEALRVIDRGELAAIQLEESIAILIGDEPQTWYPVPILLSAEDRLGRHKEATLRGRELLPRFATEFSKDHERELCASAWLDQAERVLAIGDLKAVEESLRKQLLPALDEAIREARRRIGIERFESDWTTLLSARLNRVQARRAALRGDDEEAVRLRGIASNYYKKLGIVNPLETSLAFSASASMEANADVEPAVAEVVSINLAPLFPIAPAISIKAQWPNDKEFSVTMPSLESPGPGVGNQPLGGFRFSVTMPSLESPGGVIAELTTVSNPRFLKSVGLSRSPTSEGTAPFAVLRSFDRAWEKFADGLTTLVVPDEVLGLLKSWTRATEHGPDFRLVIDHPGLSSLPWEFMLRSGGLLEPSAGLRTIHHFYRSAGIPGTSPVPLAWLRSALRELADPGLRDEQTESPRLRQAISTVQSEEGLEQTGVADARTRWSIDRRLRGLRGQLARVVLLVTASGADGGSSQGSSAPRAMLSRTYGKYDFEIVTASSQGLSFESLRSQLQGKTLAVVHVAAGLNEALSLGVHFDLSPASAPTKRSASTASTPQASLTVKSLDAFLKSLPETEQRPLVILDPPRPSQRLEAVRQLFLRNAFAAELHRLGNAPIVLGTGLGGLQNLETLIVTVISLAAAGHPVGFIADTIRQSTPVEGKPRLDDLLYPLGIALFAHDPESRAPGAGSAISPSVSPRGITSVTRTVHALLVGIDEYPAPIPKLSGCVNDIEAFTTYLSERVAGDKGVAILLKTLKNHEATRQAVIDAFHVHLGQAKRGDVALFYYSGHGSQEQAPEEFWKIEPDHLDETLVLFDSRTLGSWDLADKEIAKLIGEVAVKGPHVAVILDCCHSGSGTREIGTVVRRVPTDQRRRPIESFLLSAAEAASASRSAETEEARRYTPPEGRHVLFAACRDDEDAKEYSGNGKRRGAFSFFLVEALTAAAGTPTYRDLFARASALLSSQVPNQTPQLEASRNDDLDAVFLDGVIQPAPSSFVASTGKDGHWYINAGAVHGIAEGVGDDATRLALYPFDAPAAHLSDPSKAVATALVDEVLPSSSRLVIEKEAELDPKMTYKAIIVSLPTPPLGVLLEGDAAACALVRGALKTASPEGKPSLFIREAAQGDAPEFRLVARDDQFVITRPGEDRPLVAQIDGLDANGAKQAVARLEHMARWTQIARLSNPASSIGPSDVKLTFLVDSKEVSGRDIRLEYQVKNGKQVEPTFQVSMTNNSTRTLYCGLLDLTQRFRVSAGLLKAGCVRLVPGETAWGNMGNPISASVPDEIWKEGVIEYKDLLKLIVCAGEFDARLLEQPSLDMPRTSSTGGTRGMPAGGSLNHLMQRVQTRDLSYSEPESIDDWQATEVSFTTVRPLATKSVPTAGQAAAELAGGVKLEPHAALKAEARLSTVALSTRELGNITLPRLLYDDPSVCQPLTFTASRGFDPGLSVLELTEVNDASVVTPDAPLRVSVPLRLQTNEHVVPVAYDGEFFLPLGRVASRSADQTVIALDRLPPPLADSRSLSGAIKIFFQKVISKRVGQDFPYPILAAADVAADGTVKPIRDTIQVRDRVAKAQRILLFVHGIIGDTQSMVSSVQLARLADGRPLASLYDLVLTFDYENLNTTIEESGRLFKGRLEAVGLGVGHGKTLDIVAQSMGGLVSRWFIEQEGGKQIVRRLVMLGTPNGGSPWPQVSDWATVALGLGLNHLTAIAWPASVVGGLAAWMENPTVALNEMLPTSKVLAALKQSADPAIPYVVLAGNTSIIPAAAESSDTGKASPLARLLTRLTSPELFHKVANPFFLDQENDVAVSVASMENIPSGRKPPFDVRPVACDHLSYLRDPEGLKAMAAVLANSYSISRPGKPPHDAKGVVMSLTPKVVACAPRLLPRNEWPNAARNAIKVNPANRPPDLDENDLHPGGDGERLALDITRYWGRDGVHLTVGFIDTPDTTLRKRILSHMNAWSKTANVGFVESDVDPQVRIARWTAADSPRDDGYWSNLGTDVLLIKKDRPTMNLEAFTMTTPDSEFFRVVRHETGHTLGFPHEHMRKAIIDRLDREKVIADYMKTQGWSRQEVIDQVLTPLEEASVLGTELVDQTSIMCYQIDGKLTIDGQAIEGGKDINDLDYAFAASVYPKPRG